MGSNGMKWLLVIVFIAGLLGGLFLADKKPTDIVDLVKKKAGKDSTPAITTPITFPDANLDAVVRKALNKMAGEKITNVEVAKLKSLDGNKKGIADLSGIQHCTGLTWLSLRSNKITNVSPLTPLTNLKTLDLRENQITSISPLVTLTSLSYLDISVNQIKELGPLVENKGLGSGDQLFLQGMKLDLSATSEAGKALIALRDRGVKVSYD